MLILQVDLSQLSNEELDAQEQAFLNSLSDDELNALEMKLAPSPAPVSAPLTAESIQKQFEAAGRNRPSSNLIGRMDAGVERMLDKIHPYKSGDKITDLASLADLSGRAIQHGVIMGIPKAIAGIPDMVKAVAYDPTRSLVQALNGQTPDKGPTELLANLAPLVGAAKFGLPGLIGGAKAGQVAQTGEVGTLPENLQAGTEVLVGGKAASTANKALGDPVSRFNAKVENAKNLPYLERIKQAFKAEGTNPKELDYAKDVPNAKSAADVPSMLKGGEASARALLNVPKGAGVGKDTADPVSSFQFLREKGEFKDIPSERAAAAKVQERVGGRTEVDDDGGYTRPAGQLGKDLENYAYEASTKQKQNLSSGKNDTRTTAKDLLEEIKASLEDRSGEFINRETPINTNQAFEGKAGNPGAQNAVRQSYKDAEMALQKMVSDNVKKKYAVVEENVGKNNQPITRGWTGPKDDPLISNWDDVLAEQPLNVHNLYRYRINLGEQIKMNRIAGPLRQPAAVYDKAVYDAIGEAEARGFSVDPALKAKYEDAKTTFSHYKNVQRWLDEASSAEMKNLEGGAGSRIGRIGASLTPSGIVGRLYAMLPQSAPPSTRELWRRSMAGDALMTGNNQLAGGPQPLSMNDLARVSVPERLGMMAGSVTGSPAVQGAMMGGAGMSGLASMRPAPELPPLPSDYDRVVSLIGNKPELRQQYDALVLSKDPAAKAQMRTFITQLLQEDSNKKVLGAARGGFSPVEAYKASIEAFKSSFRGVMGNP